MQTYIVQRPYYDQGRGYQPGDMVTLTGKQAKYLLLGGFIALQSKKTTKTKKEQASA